jgi:hypothetical protein
MRVQIHDMSSASDAVAHFHSFSLEARGCVSSVCGTIRTGGWEDFGHLELFDDTRPDDHVCPPLPTNPPNFSCGDGAKRNHFSSNNSDKHSRGIVWYGDSGKDFVGLSPAFDSFGPIDPNHPDAQLFWPNDWFGNAAWNGGRASINQLDLNLEQQSAITDPNHTGRANYTGYTDRYGKIVQGCTSVGLDCIPLQITNLPTRRYEYRDDHVGACQDGCKYDTSPAASHPGEPGFAEWIKYPN